MVNFLLDARNYGTHAGIQNFFIPRLVILLVDFIRCVFRPFLLACCDIGIGIDCMTANRQEFGKNSKFVTSSGSYHNLSHPPAVIVTHDL